MILTHKTYKKPNERDSIRPSWHDSYEYTHKISEKPSLKIGIYREQVIKL